MLVLSRKIGEVIVIGDNIQIRVIDIDRGKIRLGIDCPREVPIYREELLPFVQPGPAQVPAQVPAMDAEDWAALDRWKREVPPARADSCACPADDPLVDLGGEA